MIQMTMTTIKRWQTLEKGKKRFRLDGQVFNINDTNSAVYIPLGAAGSPREYVLSEWISYMKGQCLRAYSLFRLINYFNSKISHKSNLLRKGRNIAFTEAPECRLGIFGSDQVLSVNLPRIPC